MMEEAMSNSTILGKVLIYGDLHLLSKNYGSHKDYPAETLDIIDRLGKLAEQESVTHAICLGDFTHGRISSLEYRLKMEDWLSRMNRITGNNHYCLKGNHDVAGYGLTEFEYYVSKGILKPSCNMTIGNAYFTMADYGKLKEVEINKHDPSRPGYNILLSHDYLSFKDARLPNFGKATLIDNMSKLYPVNFILCGHIHKHMILNGKVESDIQLDGNTYSNDVNIVYTGCLTRPSYTPGATDTIGHVVILTIYADGNMEYDLRDFELKPLEESFILSKEDVESDNNASVQQKSVDISDIVYKLDNEDRIVGNPEDIVMAMENEPLQYRNKAIEYLKNAVK